MKNFIITILVLALLGLGIYYFSSTGPDTQIDTMEDQDTSEVLDDVMEQDKETVIGDSSEGREITAYHYGEGAKELLFVGGIHGGYSWNTSLVAFEMMDYLEANPSAIPEDIRVTVIPVLNPDGLNKVVGTTGRFTKASISPSQDVQISGRFNGNNVDINRNFDCEWKSDAIWQTRSVSGGDAVFSEPESKAIRDYIRSHDIEAAVVWYSAAGGVYSSSCGESIMPETRTITNLYADASNYPAYDSFDFYPTKGDMVNWLAKNDIPAISVLLTNHQDVEWGKNKLGMEALLEYYSQ